MNELFGAYAVVSIPVLLSLIIIFIYIYLFLFILSLLLIIHSIHSIINTYLNNQWN